MSRLQEVLGQIHETCYIRQALMEFKHPKYYAEMRAERRKLQAPSFKHGGRRKRPTVINEIHDAWATDNGYGSKDQAIQETVPWNEVLEATSSEASSNKPQAPSRKPQASSRKRQAP